MRKSVVTMLIFVFAGCVHAKSPKFLSEDISFNDYSVDAPVWWQGRAAFTGQVSAPACSLALDDAWQSVDMGDAPMRELQQGGRGHQKSFSLRLKDCELAGTNQHGFVGTRLRVTFDGLRGETMEQFALMGRATGVELQILDRTGYIARAGHALPPLYVFGNEQELYYTLRLVRNNFELNAGEYYAVLRFKIHYE